jgi:hypothetical protein
MTTTTRMVVGERNVRKVSPVRPEKTATPILTAMKQVAAVERKSAETRKEKSFPVPPPEKEKKATPIPTTRTVAERKSAKTRKEKSFLVPPPAPEKKATPIPTTRMETGKSAYPNQASPVPLEKAERAKKAT